MTAVRTSARTLLAQEYRDVAELLRTLTPEEWDTESLCAGWRVRDVVAHLLYEATPPARYVAEIVRSGGSMDRLNELYIRRGATKTTDELLAAFATIDGQGLGARVAPRNVLADLVIHHQDIRRPLGRPRTVPTERLLTLLRHPDPFLRPGPRMRGLRFAATDVDWEHGSGPSVTGPGEAIFMAIAGRAVALAELRGAGVDTLRARLR